MKKYLCGTPVDNCTGGMFKCVRSWKGSNRAHSSRIEAFKCYVSFLKRNGYKQIGTRDFIKEGGTGEVLFLSKKSKFGASLRLGKEGSRFMPEIREGGIIVSC